MESLQSSLFEAAAKGCVDSLQQLLTKDSSILERDLVDSFNETPLHVAARLGHVDFVKKIIEINPQLVYEVNLQKHSPLHLAAAKGRVHVVKLLLEVQPDAARKLCEDEETILHLCVKNRQLETLKLIVTTLNDPEFVNSKDAHGNTVLHLAVADKQVETTKFLVSMGAPFVEVNAQNEEGLTAMDVLIRSRKDVRDSSIEESLKLAGDVFYIRDIIHKGKIFLKYIKTTEHPADILTKAVGIEKLHQFKEAMKITNYEGVLKSNL